MGLEAIINELQAALTAENTARAAEAEAWKALKRVQAETAKHTARVRELEAAIRTGQYQGELFAEPERSWSPTGPADYHGRRTRRKREVTA